MIVLLAKNNDEEARVAPRDPKICPYGAFKSSCGSKIGIPWKFEGRGHCPMPPLAPPPTFAQATDGICIVHRSCIITDWVSLSCLFPISAQHTPVT